MNILDHAPLDYERIQYPEPFVEPASSPAMLALWALLIIGSTAILAGAGYGVYCAVAG